MAQSLDEARPSPARGRGARWLESAGLPLFWAILVAGFTALRPQTFLTASNIANILGSNTVLLVVTLAALLPLVLGDFDLSVGAVSGLAAMVTAVLNAEAHWALLPSCLAACGVGMAVGAINAIFVVGFGNDTFIVTLASGTIATGLVYEISNSNTISGLSPALSQWTFLHTILGVPLQFYYGLGLVALLWYLLRWTPLGQQAIFVGQSREVARLQGIPVPWLRAAGFIGAGLLAACAGLLAVGMMGAADPSSGPSLLLPAFAAAFLGTTTVEPGRFNVLGATIAVYFLATGVAGLQLLGAQNYIQDVFYGGALITAVTVSGLVRRRLSS
ncbi:MAG: ABC transporter permease [Firmicutes bacterium]|nr:ABC transporter permease [Alicyclobacillaceae bacterium]MCL6497362.1 ABC transporter permease [Bacillota bacterium]